MLNKDVNYQAILPTGTCLRTWPLAKNMTSNLTLQFTPSSISASLPVEGAEGVFRRARDHVGNVHQLLDIENRIAQAQSHDFDKVFEEKENTDHIRISRRMSIFEIFQDPELKTLFDIKKIMVPKTFDAVAAYSDPFYKHDYELFYDTGKGKGLKAAYKLFMHDYTFSNTKGQYRCRGSQFVVDESGTPTRKVGNNGLDPSLVFF